GTPIPHAQASKLLCGGEFHRVVFGADGQILDSGRATRLFTAAQTRAVIARDRQCQFPDCTAPPEQGEIHHSIWWYHHGRTSTVMAILLCWYHPDYVHQHGLNITHTPGGCIFTDPLGAAIGSSPPPGAGFSPAADPIPELDSPPGSSPPGRSSRSSRPPGS